MKNAAAFAACVAVSLALASTSAPRTASSDAPVFLARGAFANSAVAEVGLRFVDRWGGEACREAGRSGLTGDTKTFPVMPRRNPSGQVAAGGEGDGQCRAFVNCVVRMASGGSVWLGGGGGDYFKRFAAVGASEIKSVDALRKGDIVQEGHGRHTYIVIARVSGETFEIVDSNGDYTETVRRRVRQVKLTTTNRAFRVGTVNTNQPRPPTSAIPANAKPPRTILTLSGAGTRTLRFTLPLERAGEYNHVVYWTHNGAGFELESVTVNNWTITSRLGSGYTWWPSGEQEAIVRASGAWTLRFVVGVKRPEPIGGGLVGFRGNGDAHLPTFWTKTKGRRLHWWLHSGSKIRSYGDPDFSGRVRGGAFSNQYTGNRRGQTDRLVPGSHFLGIYSDGSWTVGWKP